MDQARFQKRPSGVGNVRFGSKADMCSALGDVRFTPNSGHLQRNNRCPLCANSGRDNYGSGAALCSARKIANQPVASRLVAPSLGRRRHTEPS